MARFRATTRGLEALEAFVEVWGNYIPDIHGLAKALLTSRDTEEAARHGPFLLVRVGDIHPAIGLVVGSDRHGGGIVPALG